SIAIPEAVSGPDNFVAGQGISDLPISKKGTIKDIKVGIQITHPDTSDLDVLVKRGGTYVPLAFGVSGPGTTDNNFRSGAGCAGGLTVFDGAATRFIIDSSNPFDGSFLPNSALAPLGLFNGEQLKGTWRLVVTNFGSSPPPSAGTITCFQVTAKYRKG